jgi:hypothetical protein
MQTHGKIKPPFEAEFCSEKIIVSILLSYCSSIIFRRESNCQCQELFCNIRFFQLDPKFITDRVVPDLAKGIGICKDEIKQAIIYQSSDKKKRQAMDTKLNHRCPSRVRKINLNSWELLFTHAYKSL